MVRPTNPGLAFLRRTLPRGRHRIARPPAPVSEDARKRLERLCVRASTFSVRSESGTSKGEKIPRGHKGTHALKRNSW